jgi:hypothetical protein
VSRLSSSFSSARIRQSETRHGASNTTSAARPSFSSAPVSRCETLDHPASLDLEKRDLNVRFAFSEIWPGQWIAPRHWYRHVGRQGGRECVVTEHARARAADEDGVGKRT